MHVLVTGATGFVASQIVTDLQAAGHTVTCCVRNINYAKSLFPNAKLMRCNFVKDTSSEIWLPRLKNIDVVINCVGILHHPNKKNIWAIHYDTPRALFTACITAKVKRIIQISALGVDKATVDYATSKKAADDFLLNLPISSFVLRPSLVYGRGSYGGTSLFRGLSGLPFFIPVPGNGKQQFQPIHLQDLSKAILKLLDVSQERGVILNAVGPLKVNLRDILLKLRAWLGFGKAIILHTPLIFIRIGSFFGNFLPNTSMNKTSYTMMMQNNVTNEDEVKRFNNSIGFTPRNFLTGLYSQPSTVQDHWHAKLYFLKPLLQLSIAFVWIFSGICAAFLFPKESSYLLLTDIGIKLEWQPLVLYSASALDIVLGLATFVGFQLKKMGVLQCIVMLFYSLIVSWKLPALWIDPFGPITKNIPLFVAILIMISLESDR